jgi:beta-lactamase superfamily II metal-dependent hydrolase
MASAAKKPRGKSTADANSRRNNAASNKGARKAGGKKKADDLLRVRMYRVGFGDFFLLTVPSADGPQHILIDCGVTNGNSGKGDIHTIKAAVAHMAEETKGRLALIVVTHRHMDHIIGFSRCEEIFKNFKVDAIWMSIWETEYKSEIVQLQADLNSLAFGVHQYLVPLAGSEDPAINAVLGMLENATGMSLTEGPGGGTNAKSLQLLKTTLGVKPQYLSRGETPKLPAGLVAAGMEAIILGPPPVDATEFMKLMDLKKGVGQYLDAVQDGGNEHFAAFGPGWKAEPTDYPTSAFREWAPRKAGVMPDFSRRYPERIQQILQDVQPAALYLAAKQLDDFLNNQSLVVLFTWKQKKLLFAGDAQAGNWEYWLYDLDQPSKTGVGEKLTEQGESILGSLDFYKMGHHGSTNATPISAVTAMGKGFAAMCSTEAGSFGSVENESEVPRIPLLDALVKKCALVRSDQFAATVNGETIPPQPDLTQELPKPERGRFEVGSCFVDYLF